MAVQVYGCNHVVIEVDDVGKTVTIYKDVCNLEQLDGTRAGAISRADVAGFCLRELVDDHYLNQAPVITY